jgi:Ala-tRNA(Pro) deacylase
MAHGTRRFAMECRERLEAYLTEHGVPFEVQEHRPAFTAQRIAASEHVPGRMFAKVVMAEEDGELLMLVLPASKVVDTRKASEIVGRPVRLATEREFAPRFPDCEAGAMPPFGNLYQVPVVVDRDLGASERIVFQAGTHTVTMSVPYGDFERLVRPTVADLAVAR